MHGYLHGSPSTERWARIVLSWAQDKVARRGGNLIERALWYWLKARKVQKLKEKNWIKTMYGQLRSTPEEVVLE